MFLQLGQNCKYYFGSPWPPRPFGLFWQKNFIHQSLINHHKLELHPEIGSQYVYNQEQCAASQVEDMAENSSSWVVLTNVCVRLISKNRCGSIVPSEWTPFRCTPTPTLRIMSVMPTPITCVYVGVQAFVSTTRWCPTIHCLRNPSTTKSTVCRCYSPVWPSTSVLSSPTTKCGKLVVNSHRANDLSYLICHFWKVRAVAKQSMALYKIFTCKITWDSCSHWWHRRPSTWQPQRLQRPLSCHVKYAQLIWMTLVFWFMWYDGFIF